MLLTPSNSQAPKIFAGAFLLIGLVFHAACFADTVTSQSRHALVIGNSNYKHGPLQNPRNDANDMGTVLRRCGFDVILKVDCTKRMMQEAMDDFSRRLREGGTALFYYAGHGLNVDGRNYLVPLDATLATQGDVQYECVDAGQVLARLEDAGTTVNIIILDACRNNPLARSWRRSAASGLASMDAPTGSIIAFATAPGSVASDGTGRNGLYTSCLLSHIEKPGVPLVQALLSAHGDVKAKSASEQIPWLSISFTGEFYFVPGSGTQQVASLPPAQPPAVPPSPAPETQKPEEQRTNVAMVSSNVAPASSSQTKVFDGIPFVWIPAGSFNMGSVERAIRAQPVHSVTISQGFWMGQYEVTQGQWMQVMGKRHRSAFNGDDLPVDTVTYDNIQEFLMKLNASSDGKYRLPTEAEWEYACRAGTSTEYFFGPTDLQLYEYAWYSANSGGTTHPVGSLKPNPWGLYDILGNVWEWVSDYYDSRYYAASPGIDPMGPGVGKARVIRGGSWRHRSTECHPARRDAYSIGRGSAGIGFRLVRSE